MYLNEQAADIGPTRPRNRLPFAELLTTNRVSHFDNMITFITVPWFVLELTGSAAWMGLTVAMGALPMVIAGTFGGVFVDRICFRSASILADLISAVAVCVIALLHLTMGIQFWQLLTLVFRGALLDIPGYTARMSLFLNLSESARF